MDSHPLDFTNHRVIKEISNLPNRSVYIVTLDNQENSKPFYIMKVLKAEYGSKKVPLEIEIHLELSRASKKILKFYYYDSDDRVYRIFIEYCEKGDLSNFIKSKKNDPENFSAIHDKCLKLAQNLKILHELNICHRDIKPHNIFITKKNKLKLGDFGCCKYVELNGENQFNTLVGTQPYFSPELILKFKEHGSYNNVIRDDIFALGKVFFEISTCDIYTDIINKSNEYLKEFIYQKLRQFNYPVQFINLIQKMMCLEIDKFLKINQVIRRLRKIIIQPNVDFEKSEAIITPRSNIIKTQSIQQDSYETVTNISGIEDYNSLNGDRSYIRDLILNDDRYHIPDLIINNDRYYIPDLIIESISQLAILPTKICCECKKVITNEYEKLECGHFYDRLCFLTHYNKRIENVKKKTEILTCKVCSFPISFEILSKVQWSSLLAKTKANLLFWSSFNFNCPKCGEKKPNDFLLNSKFKFYKVKCKVCYGRFCSFCGSENAHIINCKALKDILKGRQIEYILD